MRPQQTLTRQQAPGGAGREGPGEGRGRSCSCLLVEQGLGGTDDGKIAEVQATAEGATYDEEALLRLLRLARIGCDRIFAAQMDAVK